MKNAEGFNVRNHIPHPITPAIIRWETKIAISNTSTFEGLPCWEWTGCKSKTTGYGQFKVDGRRASTRKIGPHVFAYEQFVGEVPAGYDVHHKCYNRACCNPRHLDLKTRAENVLDPISKTLTAANAIKTHCKWGHPLSGDNLYLQIVGKKQRRACRICRAINVKRCLARKAIITKRDATY